MNLSLTPQLEMFVREGANSGDYNNTSQVVREAIRLFKRFEDEQAIKLTLLKNALKEGEESLKING